MSVHPSMLDAVVGDSTTHPIPHVLCRVPANCRSCLKSGGGKHMLSPTLAAMRPASRTFGEFREPFASSAAMSFHMIRYGLAEKVWLNDLDPHVANFWTVLRDYPAALIRRVQALRDDFGLGSIELFRLASEMVDHPDPIETAAGFFVRNRISYGGTNGKSSFNPSYPRVGRGLKQVFIDYLWQFSAWLQGVTITCLDYKAVVAAPGENVFIFLDPPYSDAGDVTYLFGVIDFDEFAGVVNQSPHACLLTVNDCPANRERFTDMHPVLRPYHSSMGTHSTKAEIIAANYTTPLYPIYARQIGTPLWHGTRLSALESRAAGNDNITPVVEPSAPTMVENVAVERSVGPMVPSAVNDDEDEYPMRPVGDNKKALFINEGNEKRNPEWYTPDWLLDLLYTANGERPFDVDPCSPIKGDAAPVWAKTHYTKVDDGLSQPWHERLFLNPPYRGLEPWLKKAADAVWCRHIPMSPTKESASRNEPLCETVVALIPARTHTRYWRRYVTNHARVLFINGKKAFRKVQDGHFYYPKSPFPEGLALVIWGNHQPFTDYLSAVSPDVIDVTDRSHPTIPDLPFRHYWSQREFRPAVVTPVHRLIEQDNTRRILHRSGLKAANDNASGSGRTRKRSKSKASVFSGSEKVLGGDGVATLSAEGTVPLTVEADTSGANRTTMPAADQPIIEHVVSDAAKVYEGDCVDGMRRHVPDGSVDLIVADPPYAINGDKLDQHYHQGRKGIVPGYAEVSADHYPEFCQAWIDETGRVLRPGGSMYVVSGWSHLRHIENAIANTGLEMVNHLIWHYKWATYTKRKFVSAHAHILYVVKPPMKKRVFNFDCRFSDTKGSYQDRYDVWQIPRQYRTGQTRNQNQLPDALVEKMIDYSSKPGDVVLDPFLGGFTTATVALRMGRRVIGFEKNPNAVAAFLPALRQKVEKADNDNLPLVDATEAA